MSELLKNGLMYNRRIRPMTAEELEKHNKEATAEWAKLAITFTKEVLFEKYEPFKLLIKKGWLEIDL